MNLKPDFISIIQSQTGADAEKFFEALQEPQSTSVRINDKVTEAELDILSGGTPIPYCATGYSLPSRPDFTLDPMLHGGAYYVQEASSMYLESIISKYITGNVKCIDLCAAPGGKSTHLASLLTPDSLIISNEIMPQRANILAENMIKWGNENTIVTNNKPADFKKLGAIFDIIVACSGEGMFRKEPQAVEQWSLDNVMMCAERQKSIISDIWSNLKEGGLMVYSTCTFNRYEDEENVRWIIDRFGADAIPLDVNPEWNILGSLTDDQLPVYHFMPHRTRGEGFFISLLHKPDGVFRETAPKPFKCNPDVPASCRGWLSSERYDFFVRGDSVYALPSGFAADMNRISRDLYALIPGVEVAVRKGHDWIPAHALAMSDALRREAFNCVEVTRQQALSYLHCDAIHLEDAPLGIVLLTYNMIPLGFVKNLGSRANNMYPQEWRIRMDV